jgi:hypothetical protein
VSSIGAAFSRANDRLFAHAGEEAILRTSEEVDVIVADNVEIYGEHGQVEQMVTTAMFRAGVEPKARDSLTILAGPHSGLWVLDKPVERKGAFGVREWILRPA